jgi:hypothetical protein
MRLFFDGRGARRPLIGGSARDGGWARRPPIGGSAPDEKEPPIVSSHGDVDFDGGDKMDLSTDRVTPCVPLMRALRGVMLNGLCEGVKTMSVELDAQALPDFVQCMHAGVIGSMRELHVSFVQGTPPGVIATALRSVTEGNPRLQCSSQSGRRTTFTARPWTPAVQAEIAEAYERWGRADGVMCERRPAARAHGEGGA